MSEYVFVSPFDTTVTVIDYSLKDGRVREFVLHNRVMYSEHEGVAVDGWRAELWKFIVANGLNKTVPNKVYPPSFVYKFIEEFA